MESASRISILYVGRDFLGNVICSVSEKGESFGEAEFKYFRRWSTGTKRWWVIVNTRDLTMTEMIMNLMPTKCGAEGLGRACQRLIDYGRCEYMRKELLGNDGRVSLSHYVYRNFPPQNAMLFGIIAKECKD